MNTAVLERTASPLPTDEHYARNLIGGHWQFPAAPYEFEIRNPADSTISAVVPLSSRFDVGAAYRAAGVAAAGRWAVPAERMPMLHSLLEQMTRAGDDLAQLQAVETGLSLQDSRAVLSATLDTARTLLSCGAVVPTGHRTGGVSGHILSWGAPFTEILTSVLPALVRGDTVIVKPSLRGPLTPVAFGLLATDTGLPPGVVNIVQGTGGDIGADLIGRRELCALYVRGSERTIAQAVRGHARAHVPLHVLRGGGNVFIVGPDVSADHETLIEAITHAVRINSAGGPFGLPLLAVHADQAEQLLQAVLPRLSDTVAAPLPTEPLRRRAVQRIDSLLGIGARAVLGGPGFPDDISHRMSWRLPPTVLLVGDPDSPAARFDQASVPLGPVLNVVTWNNSEQLRTLFTAPRARDGVASLWGVADGRGSGLPHGRVIAGPDSPFLPLATTLAPTWTGGAR